jgi:hypothetical protein
MPGIPNGAPEHNIQAVQWTCDWGNDDQWWYRELRY